MKSNLYLKFIQNNAVIELYKVNTSNLVQYTILQRYKIGFWNI